MVREIWVRVGVGRDSIGRSFMIDLVIHMFIKLNLNYYVGIKKSKKSKINNRLN